MAGSEISSFASEPRGMTAIGVFFLFGAVMACLAGITLAKPGTFLDRLWKLNPRAYHDLAPSGKTVGPLFLILAVALVFAGVGWLKRRRWAWHLGVAIIGAEVVGNFVSVFVGRVIQGVIGITIAGGLLLYVTRGCVRAAFVAKARRIVLTNGV